MHRPLVFLMATGQSRTGDTDHRNEVDPVVSEFNWRIIKQDVTRRPVIEKYEATSTQIALIVAFVILLIVSVIVFIM